MKKTLMILVALLAMLAACGGEGVVESDSGTTTDASPPVADSYVKPDSKPTKDAYVYTYRSECTPSYGTWYCVYTQTKTSGTLAMDLPVEPKTEVINEESFLPKNEEYISDNGENCSWGQYSDKDCMIYQTLHCVGTKDETYLFWDLNFGTTNKDGTHTFTMFFETDVYHDGWDDHGKFEYEVSCVKQ